MTGADPGEAAAEDRRAWPSAAAAPRVRERVAGDEAERRWSALVRDFLDDYFEWYPDVAVHAGRHEHDGRLPDWDPAALDRRMRWLRSVQAEASNVRAEILSPAARFEREHLLAEVRSHLFWLEKAEWPARCPAFYSAALDPAVYVRREYAPLTDRLRAYIAWASEIPRAVEQIRGNLRTPMPAAWADFGQRTFNGLSLFFREQVGSLFGEAIRSAAGAGFARANEEAARATEDLAAWFAGQRERGDDGFALGPERFRAMLRATEAVDVDLDELRRIGEGELERNLADLEDACARVRPGVPVREVVEEVRARKPVGGLVVAASGVLERLETFVLARGLVAVPDHPGVGVEESPPYMRWNNAYIDIPGPYDRHLPSTFYLSPPEEGWSEPERDAYLPSRATLLFTAVHEVWPGHFVHFLHANRTGSELARVFVGYAFAEGWAHYAEELMWEEGLADEDPDGHVGMLLEALVRTVRYLVAIGLHTGEMGVAEAERMFRERGYVDGATARQQAARGTFDPAYLNYTLGKLIIRKIREDWRDAGGADIREFHDRLLSFGSPPLPLVREALVGSGSLL